MINPKKIVELRHKKGLSQQQFADLLHVHRSMVAKYESGENQMTIQTLASVCMILETTPNELMGYAPRVVEREPILEKNLIAILTQKVSALEAKIKRLQARRGVRENVN